MKHLTMIEMEGCPYCANAHRAMDALRAEGGAYADVTVEFIDENRAPEKTQPYTTMCRASLWTGKNSTRHSRGRAMTKFLPR